MKSVVALLAMLLAMAVSACSTGQRADRGPVVLAAASLQDALQVAAEAWAAKGHAKPVLSFAGTSALARQIESGAPADLFVSADEKWMDEVAGKGLIAIGSRADVLGNSLVLVAPAGSGMKLDIAPGFPLADALGKGRLAMADPAAVPAGRYGKAALSYFGVWEDVADKVAPAENVRAALALVGRGEAPLGIVYATDARADPGVRIVARFPAESHAPIRYPIAMLKTSRHEDASTFRTFLMSDEAETIFRRFGFTTLSGS